MRLAYRSLDPPAIIPYSCILRTFLGNRCPLIKFNFIDLFIDFIL